MLVLELLGIFVIGYLIGSIPTGYLLVKKRANVDIREVGSGKIGGYNAFSATKSKTTGILVGVLDALKGLAVVYGAMLAFHDSFSAQAVALFGAIAGQTYRVLYKEDLNATNWNDLLPDVTADGATASKDDSIISGAQRYYRILVR